MNVVECNRPGHDTVRKRKAENVLENESELRHKAKCRRTENGVERSDYIQGQKDDIPKATGKVALEPVRNVSPQGSEETNQTSPPPPTPAGFPTLIPTAWSNPSMFQAPAPLFQISVPQVMQPVSGLSQRMFPMGGVPMAAFAEDPLLASGAQVLASLPTPQLQVPGMFPGFQSLTHPATQPKLFVVYPDGSMGALGGQQSHSNVFVLQNPGTPSLSAHQMPQQSPFVLNGILPAGIRIGGAATVATAVAPPALNFSSVEQSNASNGTSLDANQHPPVDLYMSVDEDILSDHQIFLRKQIEYFEAGRLEVQSVTHGGRKGISIGQVGIRCKHCSHIPPKKRPKGSMYYPSSFRALYQAAQNMAAGHFTSSCETIGEEKKAQFRAFQAGKISAGHGGKKYWADCAKAVRIIETDHGLRFKKDSDEAATKTAST